MSNTLNNPIDDTNLWVDTLLAKLDGATNGVLSAKIGDQTVEAFIGDQTVQFFRNNKVLLIKIGLDLFKQFLMLIHEKRDEEAFAILLQKMEADEIIAKLTADAMELQQMNDDHDAFIASLRAWAIQTLTSAATKLLLALLP